MTLLSIAQDTRPDRPRDSYTASDWHAEALEYADRGDYFAGRKMPCIARSCFLSAMRAEATAAGYFRGRVNYQPTRAVLYRSAAALALRAGEHDECRAFCEAGIAGAPFDLAIEMRGMAAGLDDT